MVSSDLLGKALRILMGAAAVFAVACSPALAGATSANSADVAGFSGRNAPHQTTGECDPNALLDFSEATRLDLASCVMCPTADGMFEATSNVTGPGCYDLSTEARGDSFAVQNSAEPAFCRSTESESEQYRYAESVPASESSELCYVSGGALDYTPYVYTANDDPTLTADSTQFLCDGRGTVLLSGENWTPGTKATLTMYSTPTLLGEVTVDADGSFSSTFRIPALEAGTHTIVAEDGYGKKVSLVCTCLPVTTTTKSTPTTAATPSRSSTPSAKTGAAIGSLMIAAAAMVVFGGLIKFWADRKAAD